MKFKFFFFSKKIMLYLKKIILFTIQINLKYINKDKIYIILQARLI